MGSNEQKEGFEKPKCLNDASKKIQPSLYVGIALLHE